MKRYIYLILTFTLMCMDAHAQNVTFLTSRQGLSNSCIRHIYEDARNNIWITTQNGLNRYDGNKFNVYSHVEGDSTSLAMDETICVLNYKKDKVFIGTGQGAQIYDYNTDRFLPAMYIRPNGDTLAPHVVSVCEVDKGKFVVCTAGFGVGVLCQTSDGGYIVRSTEDYSMGRDKVSPSFLYKDKKGVLWAITGDGRLFGRMNGKDEEYVALHGVKNICESSSGRLYVATYKNGIYVYDRKRNSFSMVVSAAEAGAYVECVRPWNKGRLFICTDGNGLRVYDEKSGNVMENVIRVNDFDMSTSNVKDAMSDSYGNVWVGVYWRGLMLKSNNQTPFEYVGRMSLGKNAIGDNSVSAMAKAKDGNVWVATCNDGLYLMKADGTSSVHFSPVSQSTGETLSFTSIANADNDALLMGTWNDGLWLMENGHFSCLSTTINNIFEVRKADEKGCYWISSMSGGLYYFDLKNRTYRYHYTADWSKGSKGTLIINNPYVSCAMPVGSFLYVGTAAGITLCYHDGEGRITRNSLRVLEKVYVCQFALSQDKKTLWVATNKGLYKMNASNYRYTRYTVADGLPNNNVVSLAVAGDKLWIGTGKGLACMDVKSGKISSYFMEDGLQDNEFNRASSLVIGRHCYFGGIGGMTYFDATRLNDVHAMDHQWRLRLVDVYVGERKVHSGDKSDGYEMLSGLLDECERIDLSYKENYFSIELCIDGLHNHHVAYEYSINGGEWVNYGVNGNRLVFENLKYGLNEIRLRAVALGSMSEERVLKVMVHPAWYASGWAVLVYVLIVLVVAWMVREYVKRRRETNKIKVQRLQEQKLSEARMQFFMDISHEIRTPMTLIISPLEKLISMDKDEERQNMYKIIKDNSKRILRLVNQLMDVRKIEQGKFQIVPVDTEIVAFVHGLYDVFLANARQRNITYRFVSNVEKKTVFVDQSSLDKILMNLLSNAFKFTPDGGEIVVSLFAGKDRYSISVSDTGVGIRDEDKPSVFKRFYSSNQQGGYVGTGIGLNLVQLLVQLHKGEVVVEDNPAGSGTVFRIDMPVGEVEELCIADEADNENVTNESAADNVTNESADIDDAEGVSDVSVVKQKGCDDVIADIEEGNVKNAGSCLAESICVEKNAASGKGRHVAILVEDDESIRMYVQNELSDSFSVVACSNGQEAWEYILSHTDKADVVISDIMMPVMDGMTLCQKMKSNYLTVHIPVILMTALGDDANRISGITNGADAYISKPFNIDVLRSTALQLIKTRQMLHGKYQGEKQVEENIDKVQMESGDEQLMKRVMKAINENMDNPDMSVESIADAVGLSRVHFYRKMKEMTGQSPRDFIKYVRIKEAARLLSEKNYDITGVSVATGFKSLSTFSATFKSLYGVTPSEWMKNAREERN